MSKNAGQTYYQTRLTLLVQHISIVTKYNSITCNNSLFKLFIIINKRHTYRQKFNIIIDINTTLLTGSFPSIASIHILRSSSDVACKVIGWDLFKKHNTNEGLWKITCSF